jgi:hypothetical protein
MGYSSQTVNYQTIAALALDKLSDKIADTISTANAAFYFYKKQGNFDTVTSGGRQLRKSVLYQLQTVRPLGSYGIVNVNPVDGHTSVYFDWVQSAVPVSFTDMEEFQTSGSESIETIVKAKYQQATASIDDFMTRSLTRGQGEIDGASFQTAITSPLDGSVFILPFGSLVHYAPTASFTLGGVDQSTNTWWQNQMSDVSGSTTLSAFLASLRTLHVYCQRGGGGKYKAPDFHITDERSYNVYEKALALTHRNPDYNKADIPFDNVLFKGAPVVFDQLIPDIKSQSTTITYGTWYMLNSNVMGFTYDKASFKMGDNVRPNNQLLTTALIPVRGAHWTNNRRKLGVMHDIQLTTLEAATS